MIDHSSPNGYIKGRYGINPNTDLHNSNRWKTPPSPAIPSSGPLHVRLVAISPENHAFPELLQIEQCFQFAFYDFLLFLR